MAEDDRLKIVIQKSVRLDFKTKKIGSTNSKEKNVSNHTRAQLYVC